MHSCDAFILHYGELVTRLLVLARARSAPGARHGNPTRRDRFVRLKLYKGNSIVAGRKSPKSLYDAKIATMEGTPSAYDQGDATGFIRLNALRLKVRAAMKSSPGITKD
jgi:argininosuccinate synthase